MAAGRSLLGAFLLLLLCSQEVLHVQAATRTARTDLRRHRSVAGSGVVRVDSTQVDDNLTALLELNGKLSTSLASNEKIEPLSIVAGTFLIGGAILGTISMGLKIHSWWLTRKMKQTVKALEGEMNKLRDEIMGNWCTTLSSSAAATVTIMDTLSKISSNNKDLPVLKQYACTGLKQLCGTQGTVEISETSTTSDGGSAAADTKEGVCTCENVPATVFDMCEGQEPLTAERFQKIATEKLQEAATPEFVSKLDDVIAEQDSLPFVDPRLAELRQTLNHMIANNGKSNKSMATDITLFVVVTAIKSVLENVIDGANSMINMIVSGVLSFTFFSNMVIFAVNIVDLIFTVRSYQKVRGEFMYVTETFKPMILNQFNDQLNFEFCKLQSQQYRSPISPDMLMLLVSTVIDRLKEKDYAFDSTVLSSLEAQRKQVGIGMKSFQEQCSRFISTPKGVPVVDLQVVYRDLNAEGQQLPDHDAFRWVKWTLTGRQFNSVSAFEKQYPEATTALCSFNPQQPLSDLTNDLKTIMDGSPHDKQKGIKKVLKSLEADSDPTTDSTAELERMQNSLCPDSERVLAATNWNRIGVDLNAGSYAESRRHLCAENSDTKGIRKGVFLFFKRADTEPLSTASTHLVDLQAYVCPKVGHNSAWFGNTFQKAEKASSSNDCERHTTASPFADYTNRGYKYVRATAGTKTWLDPDVANLNKCNGKNAVHLLTLSGQSAPIIDLDVQEGEYPLWTEEDGKEGWFFVPVNLNSQSNRWLFFRKDFSIQVEMHRLAHNAEEQSRIINWVDSIMTEDAEHTGDSTPEPDAEQVPSAISEMVSTIHTIESTSKRVESTPVALEHIVLEVQDDDEKEHETSD
eukprot:GILK01001400.1.p1 GENE.GILK01001400.1~~GILK01001400.1.p1  ORF type:complete len:870 (+),score=184.66 GILK01001400.1:37-2610(+)